MNSGSDTEVVVFGKSVEFIHSSPQLYRFEMDCENIYKHKILGTLLALGRE